MFKCPKCGKETKVVQTVPTSEYGEFCIYRRIKCKKCETMFITKEMFERYTENSLRMQADRPSSGAGLKAFVESLQEVETQAVVKRSEGGLVQLIAKSKPMTREDLLKMYNNIKEE